MSTTKIEDGGTAFPCLRENDNPNMPLIAAEFGMSLRDWFAGQALVGTLAFPQFQGSFSDNAEDCYKWADAMIAARKGAQ